MCWKIQAHPIICNIILICIIVSSAFLACEDPLQANSSINKVPEALQSNSCINKVSEANSSFNKVSDPKCHSSINKVSEAISTIN